MSEKIDLIISTTGDIGLIVLLFWLGASVAWFLTSLGTERFKNARLIDEQRRLIQKVTDSTNGTNIVVNFNVNKKPYPL